jgi:hypothetical protein
MIVVAAFVRSGPAPAQGSYPTCAPDDWVATPVGGPVGAGWRPGQRGWRPGRCRVGGLIVVVGPRFAAD